MMTNVLIAIRDHRSASIPSSPTDDVHFAGEEGIRRSHHRTDVEVMREVLDAHMEGVTTSVEVGHDRLESPVPVVIHDIAPITVLEELRVQARVIRPGVGVRTHADCTEFVLHLPHVSLTP